MKQTFTLDQAKKTLVFVVPVASDLQRSWYDLIWMKEQKLSPDSPDVLQKIARIQHHLAELKQVGCEFKDFEKGHLDFLSYYDGEPVYLCWQNGETDFRYWHGLNETPSLRKPIDDDFRALNSSTRDLEASAV